MKKTINKTSLFLLIFSVVLLAMHFINLGLPWLIGSEFDVEMLENIDIDAITENYVKFDYTESADGSVFINDVYFPKENAPDESVTVVIQIYPKKIYPPISDIFKSCDKTDDIYFNFLSMRRENIKISILEYTSDKKSDKSQEALVRLLEKLDAVE